MRAKLLAIVLFAFGVLSIYPLLGVDYCLNFDGNNDYVTTNDAGTLNISGTAITLEAWLYPTDFKTNPWDNTIIGKTNTSNTNKGFVLRYGGSNGTLSFCFGDGSSWKEITAANALSLNTWQHVAASYDGAYMRLYVNGGIVGSSPQTASIVHSPANLRLSWDWNGRFMKGRLDKIRVWGITRSAADIDYYKARTLSSQTGLALSYATTQSMDAFVVDTSGNSNHGTMCDGVSWLSPAGPFLASSTTLFPATNLSPYAATVSGLMTSLGLPNPTQHGHCWSTGTNPTIADNKTELGPKNETTFGFNAIISNLSPQTTYYARTYATNLAGTSYGSVISLRTLPLAPVALPATELSSDGFVANWNPIPNGYHYYLDVSTTPLFTSYLTGYQNKTIYGETSAPVWNLNAGTYYYYRVRGDEFGGEPSPSSATITVLTVPNPPTTLTASQIYSGSFQIGWTAALGANGYRLDVATDTLFTSFVTGYQDLGVASSPLYKSCTGLNSGTTYYCRMRAFNASGESGNSVTKTVMTLPPAPASPNHTNINSTGFQANWEPSQSATQYYLDVSTDNFASYVSGYNNRAVGNVTSFVVTGLNINTWYYWRVRAQNATGASANSTIQTVKTVPTAPQQVTASIAAGNIRIDWAAVPGVASYKVYRSAMPNPVSWGTAIANVTDCYWVDNATSGRYFYRICCVY